MASIGKTKAWNVAEKSDQSQTTLCEQTITLPTAHKKVYEKPFADTVHLLGNLVQVLIVSVTYSVAISAAQMKMFHQSTIV